MGPPPLNMLDLSGVFHLRKPVTREMAQQLQVLTALQRTLDQFPESTAGDSQPSVTPAPGYLIPPTL